ncbi:hypothetical protein NB037_14030 [Rathayibacter sp. ZW T2_19]|uniref:Uncharacterized protein n=1 Tax=Rathayibacter rubneri TaxID=2950106 RepID=A0A9X2DZI3_9MICO|nr:hypothetical protein [Rathayibacter rubneri]MCM6763538.1 hypothetical protein [Rathayibacter rubneri]
MTAAPDVRTATSPRWALIAAVALLASAALQLQAATQRWVTASGSRAPADRSIEDHLFDYSVPAEPWEAVGTAAQVFGVGTLLLAAGVLAMMRALSPRVLAPASIAVAAVFALTGVHALVSGLLGTPTPLGATWLQLLTGIVPVVGLVALAVAVLRRAPSLAVAYVLLLGSSLPGQLIAIFSIAPMIMGYASHDTTPWSEAVIAATTGAAGLAALVTAAGSALRGRRA